MKVVEAKKSFEKAVQINSKHEKALIALRRIEETQEEENW